MQQRFRTITLRPGREIHLKNRHHALYRNAIASLDGIETGSIVRVEDSEGRFLCYATINLKSYICGRAISFEDSDPLAELKAKIVRSVQMRSKLISNEDTDSVRCINAEGDGIPGLIVDRYNDTAVVQLTTLGMDRLRHIVSETLVRDCGFTRIFEKSSGTARKKEGLEPREGWLHGKGEDTVTVSERGMKFQISLAGSQKTGLFLDQREMRSLVRALAADRTVLDCCCYVGGFSIAALLGGAKYADAVDYDADALKKAEAHAQLNGLSSEKFRVYREDIFDFLRRDPLPRPYDFVILDPPAFAKRSADIDRAKGAYTDLNRLGFQALREGGLMLTCSCSYQMSTQLFQTVVFHAARQANRNVRILQRHRLALDHPVNLYHPETEYLKSLLLWVE